MTVNPIPSGPRPTDLSDLPVLTSEVDGFQPVQLTLTTESSSVGKAPMEQVYNRDITPQKPLLLALKQMFVAAGIAVATGSKAIGSIKPTKLALRIKNGSVYDAAVDTGNNFAALEAVMNALDARAQHDAKGLAPVPAAAPATPAVVSIIERAGQTASAAAAPAPEAAPVMPAAVDVELPSAPTGDDKTVLLSSEDHLRMQEEHARAELAKLTGGKADEYEDIYAGYDDEPPPKPTLKQRILAGLPGALTSGAVVAATKVGVMSALGTSVSAFALAPAITTIGGIGAGIFVYQSVAHLRERWNEAEAAKGEKISLKQVWKSASKESISREWTAYRDAINNRDGKGFWKQALVKGTFAASIGAAIAWAPEISNLATDQLNKTETGASVVKGLTSTFNLVSEKVSSALSATKKFVTTSIFTSKPPVAVRVPVTGPVTAAPSAPASAPVAVTAPPATPEPTVAAAAPVEATVPTTPIDKVREMLKGLGVSDNAASKLLDRASVTEAQRINDVAVGLNNGVYGMPLNKEGARELFETAKAMGNTKSALDLDVATGRVAPPAPVAAPVDSSAAAPATGFAADTDPEGSARRITDAERRAAFDQVGLPFPEAAAPAVDTAPAQPIDLSQPPTEADAPKRVGAEVARCVLEQVEKGRNAIRTLCSVFADVMQPKDTMLVEGKGLGVVTYTNDADTAVDTESFKEAARRDFRDWSFVPWMKRGVQ